MELLSTQPSGRTLDLRSGAVGCLPVLAPEFAASDTSAAYVVADLDEPGLGRTLCAPVRRPEVDDVTGLRVVRQRCGHQSRVGCRCPPGEGERLRKVSLRGGAITAQRVGPGAHLIGSAGRRVYLVSGPRLRHVTL